MAKYFVGGLAPHTTTESLQQYFEGFSEVVDAIVMIKEGRSRGFGFVTFADASLLPMDFNSQLHIIDGKQVDVKPAIPETETSSNKLFIGGLAPTTGTEQLQDYFSQFGYITDVVAMVVNGHPRGFGFVTYNTPEEAEGVLTYPGGHVLDGRTLDVKRAEPKGSASLQVARGGFAPPVYGGVYGGRGVVYGAAYAAPGPIRSPYLRPRTISRPPPGLSSANDLNSSKIFVGGLAAISNEESVTNYFSQFGNVIECQIMRREGQSRGFGFVVFSNETEAAIAVAPHFHTIDGKAAEVKACLPKDMAPPAQRGGARFAAPLAVPTYRMYPMRGPRIVGGMRGGYGATLPPRYRPY